MTDLRDRRRRQTEQAIVAAATELFLRDGYARTTLAAVAERAGVAARTVYVRFDRKATLFQRVIEAATVGDIDATPLPDREWARRAMSAPTLADRIAAYADGVSDMHERLGPLMAVNGEVEASEPAVQESAAAARRATVAFLRAFWERAEQDGLLPPDVDLEWLIDTSVIVSAAETRLVISRHLGWRRQEFHDWIAMTWWRIIGAATVTGSPATGAAPRSAGLRTGRRAGS